MNLIQCGLWNKALGNEVMPDMLFGAQVGIAKHGLQTLLTTNYYFTEVLSQGGFPDPQLEQKLVWLCGGILSNIALHPNNRLGPLTLPAHQTPSP